MSKHQVTCADEGCERAFLTDAAMEEHAAAVHTHSDIRSMVGDALRDAYGRRGDYRVKPSIPSIYVFVVDIADDWVIFEVDSMGSDLWQVSYSIVDSKVTLGEAFQVLRRTVYDPVANSDKLAKNSEA